MIYDPSGKLSSGVNIGTKITNIMGTLSNYFGMIEFVPTADVTQISPFNSYDYTVATLDQFDADHANELQAKVVKVEGVQFATPGTFCRKRDFKNSAFPVRKRRGNLLPRPR